MEHRVTPQEAQAALDTVERGRLRIIDEIDVPTWYCWGLAIGWLALGVIADLDHAWLTSVATFVFGTVHATVASRVAGGRHRSASLSVRSSVAGRHTWRLVIGALILLGMLTVALALLAQADGARHPVTAASVVVSVIIVLGGPRLFEVARRRAASAPVS
jgi:hypothetical protein